MTVLLQVTVIVILTALIVYMAKVQRGSESNNYRKEYSELKNKSVSFDRVKHWNKPLALALSILIPGAGHFYKGEISKAVKFIFLTVYCWFSIAIGLYKNIDLLVSLFIVILVISTIYAVIDNATGKNNRAGSYQECRKV